MEIIIDSLAFSPVSHKKGEEDIWVSSTRTIEVEKEVKEIFEQYLETVINRGDIKKVKVGSFKEENSETKQKLSELKNFDLEKDADSEESYKRFEQLSKVFATRLQEHMDQRTSDGFLFTILASKDGEDFVGMLKLDVRDEQIPLINDNTKKLEVRELEDALPEPEDLQKGCTFPVFQTNGFDKEGDIKFYQHDSPSDYFIDFLGCVTSGSSMEQAKSILSVFDKYKKEQKNEPLSKEDHATFQRKIDEQEGLVGEEAVKGVAMEIFGEDYKEDKVNEFLYQEGIEKIQMDGQNIPKKVKLTIDGEIDIKIPMRMMEGDRIEISESKEDDTCSVKINGSQLKQSYVR